MKRRLIKGIISLPANLFYGTGIAACVIVLDKEGSETRRKARQLCDEVVDGRA